MLKSEYTLTQTGICSPSGNFTVIQHLPQVSQAQSLTNQNNNTSIKQLSTTIMTCGQFSQKNPAVFFLTVYHAVPLKTQHQHYINKCCINLLPCIISQQLIVTTVNDILIGKVRKQTCCNKNILLVYDAEQNIKYVIKRQKQLQFASLVPRMFRCGKNVNYKIYQVKNNQTNQKQSGDIIHRIQGGCLSQFFTYLDTYQVIFPKKSNDKDKILILNAIVYLDIAKHLIF